MKCDVAVVGGGPGGAVTALELARLGFTVTLIERTKFPRRKVCGEYLNCGSLAVLDQLGLSSRIAQRMNPLRGMRLSAAGASLQIDFPGPAAGLERATLDSVLLDAACEAGVAVVNGRVIDLEFSADRVSGVKVQSEHDRYTVRAAFVVGADGCGSIVANRLGLTLPVQAGARYAMGGHYREEQSDTLRMTIERGTYFAVNPLASACSNKMLITPRSELAASAGKADRWLTTAVASVTHGEEQLHVGARIGERVAIGPLSHRVTRLVAPGALLVGDAGGFLSPFTGQGVHIALLSARAAAQGIKMIFDDRNLEPAHLRRYDKLQQADRGARSLLSRFLHSLAYMPVVARRVMHHVESHDRAREQLVAMFCGVDSPDIGRGIRALLPL